ncbi:MAG: exbD [Hydrocarboniphaga sp.]|uniref:ExbD/TolR family protein n=1 Tax=Hydrocarboniphaga sp. TaxID=2033016 RepID=UPI0028107823|nr:exbD [Hydrocarboniphaga sp.]
MGMNIGSEGGGDEDEVVSAINTTPLVDVMLVLLIIFLITIPVVTQTVKVKLPAERNQALQTKPENITIVVDKEGTMYWNTQRIPDVNSLLERLKVEAVKLPQPEVHIRGDQTARYQAIGTVMVTCQRAGIAKVGFILEPPPRTG